MQITHMRAVKQRFFLYVFLHDLETDGNALSLDYIWFN